MVLEEKELVLKETARLEGLWHIVCLIQIGYIRYSSGTGLNTVNDIHVITYALRFQKKTRNLRAYSSPTESFHICLPAVLYSIFLCHCDVVTQSPVIIRK